MFLLGFRTYPQQARMPDQHPHPSTVRHNSARPAVFLLFGGAKWTKPRWARRFDGAGGTTGSVGKIGTGVHVGGPAGISKRDRSLGSRGGVAGQIS